MAFAPRNANDDLVKAAFEALKELAGAPGQTSAERTVPASRGSAPGREIAVRISKFDRETGQPRSGPCGSTPEGFIQCDLLVSTAYVGDPKREGIVKKTGLPRDKRNLDRDCIPGTSESIVRALLEQVDNGTKSVRALFATLVPDDLDPRILPFCPKVRHFNEIPRRRANANLTEEQRKLLAQERELKAQVQRKNFWTSRQRQAGKATREEPAPPKTPPKAPVAASAPSASAEAPAVATTPARQRTRHAAPPRATATPSTPEVTPADVGDKGL